MNAFKEFLKPTPWKIIVFIFMIPTSFFVWYGTLQICEDLCPTPILVIDAIFLPFISPLIEEFVYPAPEITLQSFVALELIYLYILSCVIYFVLSKIKHRSDNT
jgi:hypothetical protein